MKKLLFSLIFAGMAVGASAATEWTLQNKTYYVDTLYHATIGPGTTQTSLKLSGAQNLRLFYTTTDLTNPYVDIRVTKASNKYTGCQTLSAQQKSADRAGARYFAGVNADFFGNSAPIGSTVVDGEVVNTANSTWVNWYMTDDRRPHIATLGFSGTATFPGGATHKVAGINCDRLTDYLVVYNKFRNGTTSGTNQYGYEVAIQPVEGSLTFNGKSVYRVTGTPETSGSMAIPAGGYVLSGHGTAAALVSALKDGDQVSLDLNIAMGNALVTQMASGQPAILKDGVTLDTQGALDHLTALNPRTAVGYDATGTRLVLMVVDGRGISVGVVSRVLADIMREVGCTDAMNFDGGGSSELYTSMFGVRNSPSDGTERAVTNAAWCVAVAPDDNTVAAIAFPNHRITLPKYGFYTPQLYAYNKYGVLIDKAFTGATLSCDAALGEVVDNGARLFANGSGTHALTATYNGVTCTVPVTIGTGLPKTRLDSLLIDNFRPYTTEVTATADGIDMPVDNAALAWTSDNTDIATVDAAGIIRGVADGTATITGTVEDLKVTLPVTVQIPTKRWQSLQSDVDIADWVGAKTGVKDVTVTDAGNGAVNLNYTVSSTRSTKVGIKPQALCHALPDSLRLVINPGDAKITQISIAAGPASERPVTVNVSATPEADKDYVITVPVDDFAPADDFATYPFMLTSVGFSVSDASASTHTIRISAIQSVHTALDPSTNAVRDILAPCPAGPDALYRLDGTPAPANPAPGLYVSRSGSTVNKVIIKH